MGVKEELHALVDTLDDEDAGEALDYLRWLASDSETLSEEDMEEVRRGEEEIARGEYLTLAELRRALEE
ncbi:MAG TPA: hypothetical protein VFE37_02125 [Chloroflexota bacterium]|nr:hypothetical protein [Chloroflexota bacterium]